jgi:hypothetical protein
MEREKTYANVQSKGKTVKRKESFLMQSVGGVNLLVPLGSQVLDMNGIITLNATGCCVWEQLAEDRSLDELTTAIVER